MSKNPLINASCAITYIIFIVTTMNLLTRPLQNTPDTALTPYFAPIIMLSLLTLSVTVMAYLFFYQPFLLFSDGKRKEAIDLFFKTMGIFAIFTCIALTSLLFL